MPSECLQFGWCFFFCQMLSYGLWSCTYTFSLTMSSVEATSLVYHQKPQEVAYPFVFSMLLMALQNTVLCSLLWSSSFGINLTNPVTFVLVLFVATVPNSGFQLVQPNVKTTWFFLSSPPSIITAFILSVSFSTGTASYKIFHSTGPFTFHWCTSANTSGSLLGVGDHVPGLRQVVLKAFLT